MRILTLKWMAFFSLVLLLALSFFLSALSWQQIELNLMRMPYRCPLKAFTGLRCAFCGMTHSWIALLKGEWVHAIHFNPLGPLVFGVFLLTCFILLSGHRGLFRKIFPSREHKRKAALLTVAILTVFMVVRNIYDF